MSNLDGKTAIITGAAGGFGQVLVRTFLGAGAKVAALDVDEARLRELSASVAGPGASRFISLRTDISDYTGCERAVAQVRAELGGVHILINNGALGMGIIRTDCMTRLVDIEEITPAMWQRFVAVNFSGAWNMTRAVIAPLRAQRWGRVVDVTTSFFTMLRGGFQPYGPCKAGVEAMAAAHAQEFSGSGVTVNVVVPGGPADTPMVPPESGLERAQLISPNVMAPPMLFLCSEEAGSITGNRYVASHWDSKLAPAEAEARCRAPIAWTELAQNPVWPGGKPAR
jgi:NAD(P)-dependent dehydrogenase (short-subunit alcohol dehydrogenase family)